MLATTTKPYTYKYYILLELQIYQINPGSNLEPTSYDSRASENEEDMY